MRTRRAKLSRVLVAGAAELISDMVIEVKRNGNERELNSICRSVGSFLGQVRQNEEMESFVLRTDWEDKMVLTMGFTEHEEKEAILSAIEKKARRLADSVGVAIEVKRV